MATQDLANEAVEPEVEDIAIEEMTEAGAVNTFGTMGSAGCPVCFGTLGSAT